MPIKEVDFIFTLSIDHVLELVKAGHGKMRVDAYSDKKPPRVPHANGHAPKLLAPPAPKGGLRLAMLTALSKRDNHTATMNELYVVAAESGYSAKSVVNVIYLLKTAGFVARAGKATYKISPNGLRFVKQKESAANGS
jgi:hypothetical protein